MLVTGLSGAGKTTALRVLEDLGWEAIDNFPIRLLERLIGAEAANGEPRPPLAIGFDSRTRGFVPSDVIARWKKLAVRVDRVQARLAEQPGQHRVPGEQRGQVDVPDEVGEPLLRRVAGEPPADPVEVQLQHEGARGDPGQPLAQRAGEVGVQPRVQRRGRAYQGSQRERERLVPAAAGEVCTGRGRGGAFHERGP